MQPATIEINGVPVPVRGRGGDVRSLNDATQKKAEAPVFFCDACGKACKKVATRSARAKTPRRRRDEAAREPRAPRGIAATTPRGATWIFRERAERTTIRRALDD